MKRSATYLLLALLASSAMRAQDTVPPPYYEDWNTLDTWTFSDGITLNAGKARRQFHHPLPDRVEVTLRSCNRWNCCADTTFTLRSLIRSVWFPNAFTPGEETDNRFGCTASFDIVEYGLCIYNRQSLLIYNTIDPAATWDGSRNGQPCPQGTYAYYWHARDAVDYHQTGAGSVTLIR